MNHLVMFWDFIDRRAVVRRIMAIGTFALVVWVIAWATRFAETSPRPGMDVAAIIGAVMAPLNLLMGFMFSSYSKSRKEGES